MSRIEGKLLEAWERVEGPCRVFSDSSRTDDVARGFVRILNAGMTMLHGLCNCKRELFKLRHGELPGTTQKLSTVSELTARLYLLLPPLESEKKVVKMTDNEVANNESATTRRQYRILLVSFWASRRISCASSGFSLALSASDRHDEWWSPVVDEFSSLLFNICFLSVEKANCELQQKFCESSQTGLCASS